MKLIDKSALVAEIRRMIKNAELYIEHHSDNNDRLRYSFEHQRLAMCELLSFLDTLEVKEVQEEPVSEELEEAALLHLSKYYDTSIIWDEDKKCVVRDFKAGALWQKEHFWKPANGDDLPEFDREVVAFQKTFPTDIDGPSLLKIVMAHRPNPKGYDGKSIATGKVEHYTPKTYDKGGWNIPNVVLWLDLNIPKLEED